MSETDRDLALATAMLIDNWLPVLMLIEVDALENLVRVLDREDTVLPLIDPTAWMRTDRDRQQRKRVYGAFLTLRRTLGEVAAEGGDG